MSFSKGRELRFLANVDPIDVARALQVRLGTQRVGVGPARVAGMPGHHDPGGLCGGGRHCSWRLQGLSPCCPCDSPSPLALLYHAAMLLQAAIMHIHAPSLGL
jgi:hypothetical protein